MEHKDHGLKSQQARTCGIQKGRLKRKHTINFLSGDALHMDNPLSAIDLDNLSFSALIRASNNLNFIVLSHRHRPHLTSKPLFSLPSVQLFIH
jgi:hypothetical protein